MDMDMGGEKIEMEWKIMKEISIYIYTKLVTVVEHKIRKETKKKIKIKYFKKIGENGKKE